MSSTDKSTKTESKNGGVTWKWLVCAVIVSLIVVLVAFYYLPNNTEMTHSYFMRYYDDAFPAQIRSLSMDADIITAQNNATLKVELIDGLSNDNRTYSVYVQPEHITHDGNIYWNIMPSGTSWSFEHTPRVSYTFIISPKQFVGSCMTENLVVSLYRYEYNGTTTHIPIDVEKIPIISHYPKGKGSDCY